MTGPSSDKGVTPARVVETLAAILAAVASIPVLAFLGGMAMGLASPWRPDAGDAVGWGLMSYMFVLLFVDTLAMVSAFLFGAGQGWQALRCFGLGIVLCATLNAGAVAAIAIGASLAR